MSGKFYDVSEEQVRLEVRKQFQEAQHSAMDRIDSAVSRRIEQNIRGEIARKNRILARSPHLAWATDAASLSSRDLAERELKELGITAGKDDNAEMMLDMHHAGRQFVRDGGKRSSMDASGASDFIDKYIGA